MANSDTPTDPQQLRDEIEHGLAELGETVQELAAALTAAAAAVLVIILVARRRRS